MWRDASVVLIVLTEREESTNTSVGGCGVEGSGIGVVHPGRERWGVAAVKPTNNVRAASVVRIRISQCRGV